MKKLIPLLLFLIPFFGFSQNQITIIDAKGYHFNDMLERMIECNLSVRYDEKEQETYLYISEAITTTSYTFSKTDVDSLNVIFDKYFEWEKKATKMKVKLEKTIKDISVQGWFKYGNGDWSNSKNKNCQLRSLFFSQLENNHQLVFQFGKITDYYNKYSDHKPDAIYFSKSQISTLRKGFSKEYVDSILQKEREKENIEDMFK
jgi:hypothetical protein